jgi:hypothetical protein
MHGFFGVETPSKSERMIEECRMNMCKKKMSYIFSSFSNTYVHLNNAKNVGKRMEVKEER